MSLVEFKWVHLIPKTELMEPFPEGTLQSTSTAFSNELHAA